VIDDPPLVAQRGADLSAEAEVRRLVAVEVSDLVAVDPKAPFAPLAVAGLDTGPRGDLVGDDLSC
jgi:hypothetical protein